MLGLTFVFLVGPKLFHPGDKLNQPEVDALIDATRANIHGYLPLLSIWMIFVSIVMWMFSRKNCNNQ
jgi:ribose/xylose/arabinose/galactoside ABC-type transport system permease subunit